MNKKTKMQILSITLITLLAISAVLATYIIYSVIVRLTVSEYSLTLLSDKPEGAYLYENVTFSGRLTLDSNGVANATIILLKNNISIMTTLTDYNGYYFFVWNATEVGEFEFKTSYEVSK